MRLLIGDMKGALFGDNNKLLDEKTGDTILGLRQSEVRLAVHTESL